MVSMIFEPNHTISRYFAYTHKNIYLHEDPVAKFNSVLPKILPIYYDIMKTLIKTSYFWNFVNHISFVSMQRILVIKSNIIFNYPNS